MFSEILLPLEQVPTRRLTPLASKICLVTDILFFIKFKLLGVIPRSAINKHSSTPTMKRFLSIAILVRLFLISSEAQTTNEQDFLELPIVSTGQIPENGNFFLLSMFGPYGLGPPLPWNPYPSADVYLLSSNVTSSTMGKYVVDDTSIQSEASMRTSQSTTYAESDVPTPPGGEGGGSNDPGPITVAAYSYPSNSFWLEIISVTNDVASLILHGTTSDTVYELMSREQLSDTNWASEGTLIGAADQRFTPAWIQVGLRTNNLFIKARTWADSDGDGLPDWWELEHGLNPAEADTGQTGVSDGYKNPAGDGWSNIYKYEHSMNPSTFYTPPPPQNVSARLDSTGSNVVISWQSGGGPVSQYVIEKLDQYGQEPVLGSNVVASTIFSFTANVGFDFAGPLNGSAFRVRANFSGGSSSVSEAVSPYVRSLTSDVHICPGKDGKVYAVLNSLPPDLVKVTFANEADGWATHFDLYATNFINGIAEIPESWADIALHVVFDIRCFGPNGQIGLSNAEQCYQAEESRTRFRSANFVNAARQLKENLNFLLRAANVTSSFGFTSDLEATPNPEVYSLDNPENWFVRNPSPPSYEYSGFHMFSPALNYSIMALNRPIDENFLYRNFIYEPNDGYTGVSGRDWTLNILIPHLGVDAAFIYDGVGLEYPLPIAFTNNSVLWSYYGEVFGSDSNSVQSAGLFLNGTNIFLSSGAKNVYGLSIDSAYRSWTDELLMAGGSGIEFLEAKDFYLGVAEPHLQTEGYYFASETPYLTSPNAVWNGNGQLAGSAPPIPGSTSFLPTNTSPLLITGVGQPLTISGWAKQAILNGYSNKFVYLEQYFDEALKIGGTGNVTTNETGLLSPYGEFFPTEPGPVAIITRPDIETGQRGTGVVNVIKLQLNVNHDSTMDMSFGGPDNTTRNRPFRFWVNNDYDRGHDVDCNLLGNNCDYEEDDLKPGAEGFPLNSVPDWLYTDPVTGLRAIPCKRDLEDYTPIHFAGVSHLITNLPTGYTITLTWRDPSTAPGINIFRAVDPTGGIAYLTNTATADNQISTNGFYIGSVSSFQTIDLTQKYAENASNTNRRLNDYFIFCASATGKGELVLQVKNTSGDLVGETSAFIEIKDIKDFYERWTCGEIFSPGSSYNITPMPTWIRENVLSAGSSDDESDYILCVHGWNMAPWEKERFAETAFKRLYWQGYKGKFGLFKWPTYFQSGSLFKDVALDSANFDRSEFNAWRSATPLNSLFNYLQGQYPDRVRVVAHSMGNIVAGEALKLAGTSTLIHTYVASQAAIPAHCYDPNTAFNMTFESIFDDHTPNAYAQYWTSTSPQYFYNIGGAANFVNYYNTNDYALSPTLWELNQKLKPDDTTGSYGYNVTSNLFFRGTTTLIFPTNTYEIFSFCDEARARALGRQPNVGGAFTVGAQIDLNATPFAFGTPHKGHSAQFRSYNALRWVYWDQLLSTFNIPR
jgi:hypothetical protein